VAESWQGRRAALFSAALQVPLRGGVLYSCRVHLVSLRLPRPLLVGWWHRRCWWWVACAGRDGTLAAGVYSLPCSPAGANVFGLSEFRRHIIQPKHVF
jgi:hypothetical protein